MSNARRSVPAMLVALALAAGNLATCVDWMATPEARLACCADTGECASHDAHAEEAGEIGQKAATSQADADRCCRASERDRSSSSPLALIAPLPPVSTSVRVVPPVSVRWEHAIRETRAAAAAAAVPKHLLLSVFLV